MVQLCTFAKASALSNNSSSSMLTSFAQNGCSSLVTMQLVIDGSAIRIAQMGPDFLLLRETIEYPPCEATIIFSVDDYERQWMVKLPEGIAAGCGRVAIAKV
jgi:hypothetical protein